MDDEDLEFYLESIERYPARTEEAERRLLQVMKQDDSQELSIRFARPYMKWTAEMAIDFYSSKRRPDFSQWDAVQAANVGLVLAILRYKRNYNHIKEKNFKAYAEKIIKDELKKLDKMSNP